MQNQAEHIYSHSIHGQANQHRASSIEFPLVSLPPVGRTRSCHVNTRLHYFDMGADADNEKTPTTNRFELDSSSISKKRRTSQRMAESKVSPGYRNVHFPHQLSAKDDPKAKMTSRKRHNSSHDLLDEYATKELKNLCGSDRSRSAQKHKRSADE
jgi:hypothetical protein